MKDDRIIRAVSDIDDAYILEADPESAGKRIRAGRIRVIRTLSIAAAALLVTLAGVFAGILLISPAKNSENKAADMQAEAAAEKYEYAGETKAESAMRTEEKPEVMLTEAGMDAEADAEMLMDDAAGAPADAEEVPDGALNEAVTAGAERFTFAEVSDGALVLLVQAGFQDITITEENAAFTLLLSDGTKSLYRVEPADNAAEDAGYGTVEVRTEEGAGEEIFLVSREMLAAETPEELQALYDGAFEMCTAPQEE